MYKNDDTICAPATVPGTGAITIIRVSGTDAFALTDRVVAFKSGNCASAKGYTLKFGSVRGRDGQELDEVLVGVFRGPKSYTGEDSTEIYCHASPFIASELMNLLCEAGARPAGPGEFTRRAYLNGRMDLAQAEAVADVVASNSAASNRIALKQMKGSYSDGLKTLRDKLLEMTALMELELDFSEEDMEFADRAKLMSLLDDALARVESLAASFRAGNALKNGVPVAIVGDVNSGKSTLLNALLGEERAIVSDIAGTTRDTVEETMTLEGIRYRFIDTAGIRETADLIEKKGIERSFNAIRSADVVIGVIDGTAPLDRAVKSAVEILRALEGTDASLVLVRNKVDVYDAIAPEEFPTHDRSYGYFELRYPAFGTYDTDPDSLAAKIRQEADEDGVKHPELQILDISAMTGEGLDELRHILTRSQSGRFGDASDTIVTNARHAAALNAAAASLRSVREGLAGGKVPTDATEGSAAGYGGTVPTEAPISMASDAPEAPAAGFGGKVPAEGQGASAGEFGYSVSTELLAEDLRAAITSLSTIWGEEIGTEEVLGEIFGRFCIGK